MKAKPGYCSRCKVNKGDFVNGRREIIKQKLTRLYLYCSDCNTKRIATYRKKNPEKIREIAYRSIEKHRKKQNARVLFNYYLRKGRITRPNKCQECNKKCRPDAHHSDYSKPLEVDWLCRKCHIHLHHR